MEKPREFWIVHKTKELLPKTRKFNFEENLEAYDYEPESDYKTCLVKREAYDELVRALERIAAHKGTAIYSHNRDHMDGTAYAFNEVAEIAREALTKISTSGSEG